MDRKWIHTFLNILKGCHIIFPMLFSVDIFCVSSVPSYNYLPTYMLYFICELNIPIEELIARHSFAILIWKNRNVVLQLSLFTIKQSRVKLDSQFQGTVPFLKCIINLQMNVHICIYVYLIHKIFSCC